MSARSFPFPNFGPLGISHTDTSLDNTLIHDLLLHTDYSNLLANITAAFHQDRIHASIWPVVNAVTSVPYGHDDLGCRYDFSSRITYGVRHSVWMRWLIIGFGPEWTWKRFLDIWGYNLQRAETLATGMVYGYAPEEEGCDVDVWVSQLREHQKVLRHALLVLGEQIMFDDEGGPGLQSEVRNRRGDISREIELRRLLDGLWYAKSKVEMKLLELERLKKSRTWSSASGNFTSSFDRQYCDPRWQSRMGGIGANMSHGAACPTLEELERRLKLMSVPLNEPFEAKLGIHTRNTANQRIPDLAREEPSTPTENNQAELEATRQVQSETTLSTHLLILDALSTNEETPFDVAAAAKDLAEQFRGEKYTEPKRDKQPTSSKGKEVHRNEVDTHTHSEGTFWHSTSLEAQTPPPAATLLPQARTTAKASKSAPEEITPYERSGMLIDKYTNRILQINRDRPRWVVSDEVSDSSDEASCKCGEANGRHGMLGDDDIFKVKLRMSGTLGGGDVPKTKYWMSGASEEDATELTHDMRGAIQDEDKKFADTDEVEVNSGLEEEEQRSEYATEAKKLNEGYELEAEASAEQSNAPNTEHGNTDQSAKTSSLAARVSEISKAHLQLLQERSHMSIHPLKAQVQHDVPVVDEELEEEWEDWDCLCAEAMSNLDISNPAASAIVLAEVFKDLTDEKLELEENALVKYDSAEDSMDEDEDDDGEVLRMKKRVKSDAASPSNKKKNAKSALKPRTVRSLSKTSKKESDAIHDASDYNRSKQTSPSEDDKSEAKDDAEEYVMLSRPEPVIE